MSRTHELMFEESAEWIRSNPFATIHDVPDQLIGMWTCDSGDATAPAGFQMSIFTFGYCQRRLLGECVPRDQKIIVPATELIELFQIWQLKLGLLEVHRRTELRVGALALFDFPLDEAIEYWYAQST
jgi:hypothetical protein